MSAGEKKLKYNERLLGTVHVRPLGKMPTSDIERTNQKREQSYQNVEMSKCVISG